MTSFEALQNYTNFVRTPGADKWSRRGCELMNAYLLEIEGRALGVFSLAYHPETLKQYGEPVMNDLLSHAIPVIRNANRLYTLGAFLEVNFSDDPEHIRLSQETIEGFRHVISMQMPHLIDQVRDMSTLARSILLTIPRETS